MFEEIIAWLPYVLLFIGVWFLLIGVALRIPKDKDE